MKILMPFINHGSEYSIDSKKVYGGIERFAQLLYQNIPGIIPVEITQEEKRTKAGLGILNMEIMMHQPDVILINYPSGLFTKKLFKYNIPIVLIWHPQADGHIGHLSNVAMLKEFVDAGGHLYFVSQFQLDGFNRVSNRVLGHDVQGVRGFIFPAFCSGNEKPTDGDFKYDAGTIGRNEPIKNIFWVHKKLQDTGLTSVVLTNTISYENTPSYQSYVDKNSNWQPPQHTIHDLPHSELMEEISRSRIFVSPCAIESFGITALEALSRGLPAVLVTNKTGRHASEIIADKPDDIRLISNSATPEELVSLINELNEEFTMKNRLDLSARTLAKHSKKRWITSVIGALETAVNQK